MYSLLIMIVIFRGFMNKDRVTFEEELARSGKLVYTNVGVSMLPMLREGP